MIAAVYAPLAPLWVAVLMWVALLWISSALDQPEWCVGCSALDQPELVCSCPADQPIAVSASH